MANIFDKWNKNIDTKGLMEDINEVEENGGVGNYKEVPLGTYEVAINKLELTESKKGDPMLTVWFKVLEGEYENSLIFMNQVVTQAFQFYIANEFLKSLGTDIEVKFDGDYAHYNDMLMDIAEEIEEQGLEYALNYGQNKKGYNTFEIEEVFD